MPEIVHIHSRMSLIILQSSYDRWLACEYQGDDAKRFLLDSQLNSQLIFHRVDRRLGNPWYEGTDTKLPILNSL